jgi:hypothetical protein
MRPPVIRCEHGQEVLPCRDAARLSSSCPTPSAKRSSNALACIRHRIEMSSERRLSCSRLTGSTMTLSRRASICRAKSLVSGASGSTWNASRGSKRSRGAGVQPAFPPDLVVAVKRLACELPATLGLPLARFTIPELHRAAVERGLVAQISGTTLWRWLSADAISPGASTAGSFPAPPVCGEGRARPGSLPPGMAARSGRRNTSSRRTRRRASKRVGVATPRRPRPRATPSASNTNTNGAGPTRTSPPGACIAPSSSAAATMGPGARRSTSWSPSHGAGTLSLRRPRLLGPR